jgi:hypothetical protein
MTAENTPDPATPDTIVLVHGYLDDPPKLGEVGRVLRGQRLPRARSCIPRS